ncbi:MAG: PrgI family protein [Candidatus Spechtbacterales bacterium]
MQYPVPQFVEREDRLLGPLTVRQTVILLGAGAIIFVLYLLFKNFFVFTLLAVIVSGVALTMAFVQVNGRPLIDFVMYFINYFFQPRKYTWRKTEAKMPKGTKWAPQYSGNQKTAPAERAEPTEEEKLRDIKNLADILNQ